MRVKVLVRSSQRVQGLRWVRSGGKTVQVDSNYNHLQLRQQDLALGLAPYPNAQRYDGSLVSVPLLSSQNRDGCLHAFSQQSLQERTGDGQGHALQVTPHVQS